ncbi:hypothetical protein A3N68_20990 [Enterobacter asburiae]|jgi:hypothetical protein|uniref:hypothetical protein n=1 Tax=Enterobacter asburiae TaxID=61645 RepID=UPI0007B3CF89|nr:hypothetical protein [Enterobacter asburiae]KZR35421.1 hypothetical protein A3N68_20990 [Enterobacter asburiae]MCM7687741.1 hypothetical protein [Enterobacter asburiae]HDR2407102.1 hypothetical protein [Enterobacter asburiae]HDS3793690.1 hypothetical protein [Enterobacter asburiae]
MKFSLLRKVRIAGADEMSTWIDTPVSKQKNQLWVPKIKKITDFCCNTINQRDALKLNAGPALTNAGNA